MSDVPANLNAPSAEVVKVQPSTTPKLYDASWKQVFDVLSQSKSSETKQVVTDTQWQISPLKNQITFEQAMSWFDFDFPQVDNVKLNDFQKAIAEKFPVLLAQAKTSVSDVMPDFDTMKNVDTKKYFWAKKIIDEIAKKYPNDIALQIISQTWKQVDDITNIIADAKATPQAKQKALLDISEWYQVIWKALVVAKDGALKNDIDSQNKLSQAAIYSWNFLFNAVFLAFWADLHKQWVQMPTFDMSQVEPAKLDPTPDMFRYLNQTKDWWNDIQWVLSLNTYNWNALVYSIEDLVSKEKDTTKNQKLGELKMLLQNSQTLSIRFQQALLNWWMEISPLYYPNYFFSTPQDFEKYAEWKANWSIKRVEIVDPANYGQLSFLEWMYIDEHNYLIKKWLKANPSLLTVNIKNQLQLQLNYNDKVSESLRFVFKNITKINTSYSNVGVNNKNFQSSLITLLTQWKIDINDKKFIEFLKNIESNIQTSSYIGEAWSLAFNMTWIKVFKDSANANKEWLANMQKILKAYNRWKEANPDLANKI